MHAFVIQSRNGLRGRGLYVTKAHPIDQGNSAIYESTLQYCFASNAELTFKSKDTDNKIVIGYTLDGMVFQIVVEGVFNSNKEAISQFINDYVVSAIDGFSKQLSFKGDAKATTLAFIRTLLTQHQAFGQSADFAMAIAVTYRQGSQLYCAGFGIGNTGIVIKRTNGKVEQLVYKTSTDTFGANFAENPDLVLSRSTTFNTQVTSGDEIVGYTHLPSDLEEVKSDGNGIRRTGLKELKSHSSAHFSQQLWDLVLKTQSILLEVAQLTARAEFFNAFTMIGRMTVPNEALMLEFRNRVCLHKITHSLTNHVKELERKENGFWPVFFPNYNLPRAQHYLKLIHANCNFILTSLAIFKVMFTNSKDANLREYLTNELGGEFALNGGANGLSLFITSLITKQLNALHGQNNTIRGEEGAKVNELLKRITESLENYNNSTDLSFNGPSFTQLNK